MTRIFPMIFLCLISLSLYNHALMYLSKESTPIFSEDDEDEASEEEVALLEKLKTVKYNFLPSKK
jgi:hypothetical protein